MSPEYLIPPSAIIGTLLFFKELHTSKIADNWGTPTPATTLVVQIDPGPIPTLIPSTPNFNKSNAASAVAIFPTIKSRFLKDDFNFETTLKTPLLCAWAVSTTIASTPALYN